MDFFIEKEGEKIKLTRENIFRQYMHLHDKFTFSIHDELYKQIAKDLSEAKTILDFGPGTGKQQQLLSDDVLYLGVELNEEAVRIAQNRLKSNSRIIQGNALEPPIPKDMPNEYDATNSTLVAYVTSAPPLLDAMIKHTTPGGLVIIATMGKNWRLDELSEIVRPEREDMIDKGIVTEQDWQNYLSCNAYIQQSADDIGATFHKYDIDELSSLAKARDLKVVKTTQDIGKTASFHGHLEYLVATK